MNQSSHSEMASETAVTFQEIGKPHAGQRLDNFLLTRLKGVPKSRIYRIIRKGEVRVNKKRVRPEYKLQEEDLVRIPPIRVADRSKPMPPGKELQDVLQEAVLYEDDDLLIVNKPAGIAVHAGTGVKTGLIESLRFMKPELERLELVHRLDKGTSGCLLIARSASALKKLSSQFKEGQVTKIYHALVEGEWPSNITEISAALERQPAQGGERFVNVSQAGKAARTHFAILERFDTVTLVEAKPLTGRTHQIRVHAQLSGHPIVGDDKYSSPEKRRFFRELGIKRLCLHAHEISFNHPATGQTMSFTADYEPRFSAAIRILQEGGG